MFVYQPALNVIDFKQKNYEYEVSAWRSNSVYNSGLLPLHNRSPIIKYLHCKLRLQFNNADLVLEQNNYTTKIVVA